MARHRPSAPRTSSTPAKTAHAGERIAKVIARAGLCSRRDAEAWIEQGRVAVNGRVLTSPAVNVTAADAVVVDGKALAQRQRTRLFLFHKPRGLVTTNKDPEGRRTVFDYLKDHAPDVPRLMSIGRLDINTEGLLLLTNDGGLARILELPATGWLRRYRVRAKGETTQDALDRLAKGVEIEGVRYASIEAKLDRQQGANCWLTMGLREGKNREIKRVLEHLGLSVNRLIRLSFGPFQLGELPEGKIEEMRTRVLRDQLGPALTRAAGCDFDAPLEAVREEEPAAKPARPERAGRPRPKRPPVAEAPPPVRHRPQRGPRKHVSALRAKADETARPRRRIETDETKDRKGRSVTIERHVDVKKTAARKSEVKPPARKPARGTPLPKDAGRDKGKTRFAKPPHGERPAKQRETSQQETGRETGRETGQRRSAPQKTGPRRPSSGKRSSGKPPSGKPPSGKPPRRKP